MHFGRPDPDSPAARASGSGYPVPDQHDGIGFPPNEPSIFPKREEPTGPQRYAAALIPDPSRDIGYHDGTQAVVLEWHEPDLSGPPGRTREGYFEVMANAGSLESALKLASALNETNA